MVLLFDANDAFGGVFRGFFFFSPPPRARPFSRRRVEAAEAATTAEEKAKASLFKKYLAWRCVHPARRSGNHDLKAAGAGSLVIRAVPWWGRGGQPGFGSFPLDERGKWPCPCMPLFRGTYVPWNANFLPFFAACCRVLFFSFFEQPLGASSVLLLHRTAFAYLWCVGRMSHSSQVIWGGGGAKRTFFFSYYLLAFPCPVAQTKEEVIEPLTIGSSCCLRKARLGGPRSSPECFGVAVIVFYLYRHFSVPLHAPVDQLLD